MLKKILALDVGSVRVGVAISDGLGLMAHPLCTLKWQNINTLVTDLEKIFVENEISDLVIGLPLNMSGKNSQQTENVLKIVEQLRQKISLPIETIDERLTTRLAENMLRDVGKKASKNRAIIDQIAAVNILQMYLDKKRN